MVDLPNLPCTLVAMRLIISYIGMYKWKTKRKHQKCLLKANELDRKELWKLRSKCNSLVVNLVLRRIVHCDAPFYRHDVHRVDYTLPTLNVYAWNLTWDVLPFLMACVLFCSLKFVMSLVPPNLSPCIPIVSRTVDICKSPALFIRPSRSCTSRCWGDPTWKMRNGQYLQEHLCLFSRRDYSTLGSKKPCIENINNGGMWILRVATKRARVATLVVATTAAVHP